MSKIIKGDVKMQEKPQGNFLQSDAKSVGSYIIHDVIVPTLKNVIYSVVSGVTSMFLFGNARVNKVGNYTDYSGMRPVASQISTVSGTTIWSANAASNQMTSRPVYDYERIVYPTKDDALTVIDAINGLIETNGIAKVADVYDFSGRSGPPSSFEVGWNEPVAAQTMLCNDGYVIKWPKPKRII